MTHEIHSQRELLQHDPRGQGRDLDEEKQGILQPGGDDAYTGDDVSRLNREDQE